MNRHLVTSTYFDLEKFSERKASDAGPLHVIDLLRSRLGATIHQPGEREVSFLDRLGGLMVGSASHWALARSVIAESEPGDLIYATGSDCGLPLALLSAFGRRRNVAVYFVAPSNFRPRFFSWVISRLPGSFLAATGTKHKVAQLGKSLGGRKAGVHFADEQTDTEFFAPAPEGGNKFDNAAGPLIVSCGLEQRDYVTLAAAVETLDVDTTVCAVSPNFTSKTRVAIPEELPERFEMRSFDFAELRELYRSAAVTVVSLLPNDYSAGLTVLLEALSSGSPVIISNTSGLAEEFIEAALVLGVPPQDATALRDAIQEVLDNPQEARARTRRAREQILKKHTSAVYTDELVAALLKFESQT